MSRTRVRRWFWKTENVSTPGALIESRGRQIFIPNDHLYRTADALVDVAEQHDRTTEQETA